MKVYRNNKLDVADMDGDKVMMNMDLGKYFALNSVGSRIWEIIEKPKTEGEIIDILLDEYDISREKCKKSVENFIEKLCKENIIVVE